MEFYKNGSPMTVKEIREQTRKVNRQARVISVLSTGVILYHLTRFL